MTNEKRKVSEEEHAAFALVGRIGGKANVKKNGKKHMRQIGKLGAEARWKKSNNKTTHGTNQRTSEHSDA